MAARLVLLDSDTQRREALASALSDLGNFGLTGIATIADVSAAGMPDLFVIDGPGLCANDPGGSISPNPFVSSGIPVILMLPSPTSEQRRAALRAGYTIILASPVPPRLLYRRIAQLLQNARRAKRRAEANARLTKERSREETASHHVTMLADASAR